MTARQDVAGVWTTNPANGETIAFHPFVSQEAFRTLLEQTHRGFLHWRQTGLEARLATIGRMAELLRRDRDMLARQATLEMGKPVSAARAEIEKCATLCDWYVRQAPELLADRPMTVPSGRAYRTYQPLGIIIGVMPWNFPYWQILRAAVPILAAGNAFVVKPAEGTAGCGALLSALAQEAGLEDIFVTANLSREQTAEAIADHRVGGVTLTGSHGAGSAVAAAAGRAIKKSLLELGGSDPFVVLADADIKAAAEAAVLSRFGNCGQVCIAAKRIIVEKAVMPAFQEAFIAATRKLQPTDPLDEKTVIGPMARTDLRDGLHRQIQASVAEGATLVLGGKIPDRPGAWYPPTILTDVRPGMTTFVEETFGPVASLVMAKDADDAISMANDSAYGLSSSLWTSDMDRAARLATQIESGSVFINRISVSDPSVPIGGIRQSGYGRELTELGLLEFTNIKTVWLTAPEDL